MSTEDKITRKLRAILSADVKGYSLLMSDDEAFTVKTLKAYRAVMSKRIEYHTGRVVDTPGDNLLAEFASVVDAVECAVEIQQVLKERNGDLPADKRLEFRIGVNIGDVIQDGGNLYGEGVNIAARIEGLADAGGVCISRNAYDHIRNKLSYGYEYLGEHSAKNIKNPVRVYKLLMDDEDAGKLIGDVPKSVAKKWIYATAGLAVIVITAVVWQVYQKMTEPEFEPARVEEMAYPLPEKPSIAVLPFVNMSGDPEQEYLGDSIAENIITALSYVPEMFVIARTSTFVYKGKSVKVKQISEELGVRYVLEGSVQKSKDRIRVTAQLIDAISGHHLWADRYDREIEDFFEVLDAIAKVVVIELQVKLTEGDIARISHKTENFEAWLSAITGYGFVKLTTEETIAKARELFKKAVKLDPKYGFAWGALGAAHNIEGMMGWSESPEKSFDLAVEYTDKSLKLDENLSCSTSVKGQLYRMQGLFEQAIVTGKRAIELGPSHDLPYSALSDTMHYAGRFEESNALMEKAMRLNPHYPAWYLSILGMNYFFLERYEEAIEAGNRQLERAQKGEFPLLYAHLDLSAYYLELGRNEEARAHAEKVIKLDPKFSLEHLANFISQYKNREDYERYIDSLQKVGIPEYPPSKELPKPSIAVLPFDNLSDDPEQGYLADGLTDELIGDLAKIDGVFVISRNSTFTYKGKDIKIPEVAKELKVRYVLEGSVQRSGNKLRIRAQLIDGKTDHHVWAESFDGEMDDIFGLQDKITGEIVTALKIKLDTGGIGHSKKKETHDVRAYEYFLKGWHHYLLTTKKDFFKAIELYQKALEIDPEYSRANAALALVYEEGASSGASGSWLDSISGPGGIDKNFVMAYKYLNRAMKDPTSTAYAVSSNLLLSKRQYKEAIAQAKKGISLDRSDISARYSLANALIFSGHPEQALPQIEEILWLDPINPARAFVTFGLAYYCMGNLKTAYEYIKKAERANPGIDCNIRPVVYVNNGMKDEASRAAAECLGLTWDSIEHRMRSFPFKDKVLAQNFANGLHSAGVSGEAAGFIKIYDEYKLNEDEMKSLLVNNKFIAFMFSGDQWVISFFDDNVCTISKTLTTEKGTYWFEKGSIWLDVPQFFWGEKWQVTVYKNPDGSWEVGNLYYFVSSFGVFPFSGEE